MLTQIRFPVPVTVAIDVLTSAILRHYPGGQYWKIYRSKRLTMELSGYLIESPQRFFMLPGRKACLTVVIVTALMMGYLY
ncbi:TPA: hypothetical protein ACK11E_001118 [Citrobacter pasteurii]